MQMITALNAGSKMIYSQVH